VRRERRIEREEDREREEGSEILCVGERDK
jgi:hypothetical protein